MGTRFVHPTPLLLDAMKGTDEAVGRYWRLFGKSEIAIKAEVVGEAAAVAKIARVAKRLERLQRRKRGLWHQRGDNGRWGYVRWGVAQALVRALPRLVALYGLGGKVRMSHGATASPVMCPHPPRTRNPVYSTVR